MKKRKMENGNSEKAFHPQNAEELLAFTKENGMELAEAQAKAYFDKSAYEGELSDEELEKFVSAAGIQWETPIYCKACEWKTTWDGFYPAGIALTGPCPMCGAGEIYAGEPQFEIQFPSIPDPFMPPFSH